MEKYPNWRIERKKRETTKIERKKKIQKWNIQTVTYCIIENSHTIENIYKDKSFLYEKINKIY